MRTGRVIIEGCFVSLVLIACTIRRQAPAGLYFPGFDEMGGRPTALFQGFLRRVGACLYYEDAMEASSLVLWSPRYHAVESNGTIVIQDASATVVAVQDQPLTLGGGPTTSSRACNASGPGYDSTPGETGVESERERLAAPEEEDGTTSSRCRCRGLLALLDG